MESDDNDLGYELFYPEGEEPIDRADRTLDIMSLTSAEYDIFLAGYSAGRASGIEEGYAACEEEFAERHRFALRVMRKTGRLGVSPDQMYDDV